MLKETFRKFIHLASFWNIFVFLLIKNVVSEKWAFFVLTLGLLVFLELEYARVETNWWKKIPQFLNLFREKEKDHFAGHIYMTIGAIVVFAAFDIRIAITAMSMTILGDFFSALIGKQWGRLRTLKIFGKVRQIFPYHKSLEGALAGLIANLGVGFFFFPDQPLIAVMMAVSASLVEVMTQKLDDNLTVPVIAGAVGQIIRLLI